MFVAAGVAGTPHVKMNRRDCKTTGFKVFALVTIATVLQALSDIPGCCSIPRLDMTSST
jgi:hypothetical protein